MFCPVCKYEFRRGFTHCNQCDVDLVDALPPEEAADHSSAASAQSQLDHPVLLWKGASGGVYSALTLALDDAHIPYNKEELDARLVFTAQHTDLEVWVPAANLSEAQRVLDAVLANPLNADAAASGTHDVEDDDGASAALPVEDDESSDDIRRENVARELYPDDATAEIWSGKNEALADVLKSCLAEIGINCYIDRPESGSEPGPGPEPSNDQHAFAVRVLPADKSRARQIVREVIDGVPPQ